MASSAGDAGSGDGEVRKSRRRTRRWNWSEVGMVESWVEVAAKLRKGSKRGESSAAEVMESWAWRLCGEKLRGGHWGRI